MSSAHTRPPLTHSAAAAAAAAVAAAAARGHSSQLRPPWQPCKSKNKDINQYCGPGKGHTSPPGPLSRRPRGLESACPCLCAGGADGVRVHLGFPRGTGRVMCWCGCVSVSVTGGVWELVLVLRVTCMSLYEEGCSILQSGPPLNRAGCVTGSLDTSQSVPWCPLRRGSTSCLICGFAQVPALTVRRMGWGVRSPRRNAG